MDHSAASLRPQGALEIVDMAADLLRRRTSDLITIVAIAVVPVIVFSLLAGVDGTRETGDQGNPFAAFALDQGDLNVGLFVAQLVIGSVLFSFIVFAITRLIVGELFGQTEAPTASLRAAVRRLPVLVALWIVVHLAELAGAFAFGIGAVIMMCALMVTVPALAAEPDHTVMSAFKRSMSLTKGARGHIFAVLLVLLLINSTLGIVLVGAPIALASEFVSGWTLVVISTGLESVAQVLVESIVAGATVYTYIDLRVRREGLDIDMRLAASA
jgi:hypothetical protein